jgi:hypothetical protein
MSVSRKFADLLTYLNPFAANLAPPPKDEDVPSRKRPRLETTTGGTGICAAEDASDVADVDSFVDAQMTHTVATASPADADTHTGVDVDINAQTQMTDATLTAPPDDTVKEAPTDAVTVAAAFLPTRASRVRKSPHKWTAEEDAKLTAAVTVLGYDWMPVAAMVPGRTNVLCRQRWLNVLDPTIDPGNKGKWKAEEDAKLTDAVSQLGKDWVAVAAIVPGRTHIQCRYRWVEFLDPTIKHTTTGKWKPEEDEKLTDAVKQFGNNWVLVAALVPGRSEYQCRYRWVECLDPTINTGHWTPEEDAKLTEAVTQLGKDWVQVAAMVPGRTNKFCRQRWLNGLEPYIHRMGDRR